MASSGDADAGLRRRVLALVRASRPAAKARRSRLSSVFARLTTGCLALAVAASESRENDRCSAEEDCVWAELARLNALVTHEDSAAQLELRMLVARHLEVEPKLALPRRASRKRSRVDSMTFPLSLSEDASESRADRGPPIRIAPPPTLLSQALGNLVLVSALHDTALVRLDALLLAMESGAPALCDAIRLVLQAEPVSLPVSWSRAIKLEPNENRQLRELAVNSDSRACDSHALAKRIVAHVAQLSFPSVAIEAPGGREEGTHHRLARTALALLEALCSLSLSSPLVQQTAGLCAVIDALSGRSVWPTQTGQLSCEVGESIRDAPEGASSQSTAFVSGVLHSFLCRASESQTHASAYTDVIDAVLRVLPSPAVTLVVRRFLTSNPSANALPTSAGVAVVSNASSSASRSVRGVLFELIRRCSSAEITFPGFALTLAHELAEDAVLHGKPWLLGHALEIVATVATSPRASPNCYKDWFQAHFGNNSTETASETKTGEDVWCCIKSSKSRTSEGCRLIHGKNHLQLVCLFLLEFDRRNNKDRVEVAEPTTTDRVKWTSSHVMAHISVLKSFHDPNSPENALVIDFCSEARVSYASLLSREQTTRTQTSGKYSLSRSIVRAPVSTLPIKFSDKARAVVDENVAYYKMHQRLSPQLKQWKTFQYLKWKSEILPCCLDVAIDEHWEAMDSSEASSSRNTDAVAQIHFVLALAKANMVPADEYARFLSKIQSRVDQTRATIAHEMQQKRQKDVASSLRRSIRRLRGICQYAFVVADKSRRDLVSECLASISKSVFAYLDSHAAHAEIGNAADLQSRQDRMLLLWSSAFVEVLGAIGVDGLDEFYDFQISLLAKFSQASGKWTALRSGRNSFLNELLDIALSHRQITPVGHGSVEWTACFAGVMASMFAASYQQPGQAIPADMLCEFSLLEDVIDQRTGAYGKWPTRELLEQKILLSTCFLRSLTAVQAANPKVDLKRACTQAFLPEVVDLWSWAGYRMQRENNVGSPNEADASSIETADILGQGHRQASWWIQRGQRVLLQTKWLEVLRERWRLPDTAKTMLDYEFRCGLALAGTLGEEEAKWTPVSTLRLHLEIADAAFASQPPVHWCEWLIDEILCLAVDQPEKSDADTERAAQEGMQAATLLLNDLTHRLLPVRHQASDMRSSLMSHWLRLTAQKLSATGEEAVASKQMLYKYSSEMLLALSSGRPGLPRLQAEDSNSFMDLINAAAHDLEHSLVSAHVRRFLLRPLLELALHRHDGGEWGMDSAMKMPIGLLVEWGQLQAANGSVHQSETHDQYLLAVIEWLGRTLDTVVVSGAGELPNQAKALQLPVQDRSSKFTATAAIFNAAHDALKFLTRAMCFVLGTNNTVMGKTQGGVDQQELSKRLRCMADAALRGCQDAGPSHGSMSGLNGSRVPTSDMHTLVPWIFEQWCDQVDNSRSRGSPLLFQLFLLHTTAALCERSALASKKLVESPDTALRAVFIVFVASVAHDTNQLGAVLGRNSSLWVNAFPVAALAAVAPPTPDQKSEQASTETLAFDQIIGGTEAFRARVSLLVGVVLDFGVEHQVDLLTASLKSRVATQWPRFKLLLERLPVLSLSDDMAM